MTEEPVAAIRRQLAGQDWAPFLFAVLLFGIIFVIAYGFAVGGIAVVGAILLLAGAALLIGMLLGFLFGIPRSLQRDSADIQDEQSDKEATSSTARPRPRYGANTN